MLKYYVEQINMQLKSSVANQPAEDNFVVCQQLHDSQSSKLIVAISTPVMKQVHRAIKHSAELVSADPSGNMDRYNARLFLLLTHSSA